MGIGGIASSGLNDSAPNGTHAAPAAAFGVTSILHILPLRYPFQIPQPREEAVRDPAS